MTESSRPRFLVVDDNEVVQRALGRLVRRYGEVVVADAFKAAAALLSDGSAWTAFFFDIELPDGSGLDLLALARAHHPTTPAMVLTGKNLDASANAALDLRALYCIKPVDNERIERFLNDAASLDPRVSLALRQWSARYGLSKAETDILRRTALGERKLAIADARRVSPETVKRQIATLLGKTGDASLQAAAGRLLRDVARL